jgi:myo-inositol-1-phosphate synthase
MDYAKRNGMYGIQDWLSFYFKSPDHEVGEEPEHDLFKQLNNLHETLKSLAKTEVKLKVNQFVE